MAGTDLLRSATKRLPLGLRQFLHRLMRPLIPVISLAPLAPANFTKRSAEQIYEDVNYAIQVTKAHLGHLSAIGLSPAGLRILELGPGINLAPQLVMASMGARMAVADRFLVPWDNNYHPAFYQAFRERWAGPVTAIDRVLCEGAHSADVISCIASPAENLSAVSTESIDLVISNAVLEHVYSIPLVCREMARITVPGGVNLHQIDFRDHRDFARPLEFLTIPDDKFQTEFDWRNGECGNRWRQSEVRSAFEQAGFEILSAEPNLQPDPSYFDEFLPRLRAARSRYQDWPTDDLMVISAFLKMRKRNTPDLVRTKAAAPL